MMGAMAHRLRQAARKPPRFLLKRVSQEIIQELDRWRAPRRGRRFGTPQLLAATEAESVSALWQRVTSLPYPFVCDPVERGMYDTLTGGDSLRILDAAERALAHEVDLLGSGPVQLGKQIDWHRDFKTGTHWRPRYFRDIDYAQLGRDSDVKVPWELSRLQWAIPAGQAYLLSGDERYALECRRILEQWMSANPYAQSVNWVVTMEVGLRIFTWTWLIRACGGSRAWNDDAFRERLLRMLYLHGEFTERYIERADVNGNHFTADAAALVCIGLFFGNRGDSARWLESGWRELCEAITSQVHADGVDFEASVPYHRLVQELFLLPAMYRRRAELPVSPEYWARLRAMAEFTAAYTRSDGSAPIWGDNDDARALPFGGQPLHDHRYLPQVIGTLLDDVDLMSSVRGPTAELFWLAGSEAVRGWRRLEPRSVMSRAFPHGGFFILRNQHDHVFVDCGPMGLADRGGHGHNDLLSFDAMLCGVRVIADSGCYVYTASVEERNLFRSTSYHNTPRIDGQEINRLIDPLLLWNLRNDARPEVRSWQPGADRDVLSIAHSGYMRFAEPVTPLRTIILDHTRHELEVRDGFEGSGTHEIEVPFLLAPGVVVAQEADRSYVLEASAGVFRLNWTSISEWRVEQRRARHAPSYGVLCERAALVFRHNGSLPGELRISIMPRNPDA
jgi:hypothetical protein